MERLTEKHIEGMNDFCHKTECELYSACPSLERYNRLAAYEDTGLEPEEVERSKLTLMGKSLAEITEFDGVAINRLKELATADKQGRLVVLPCKVGDTVWDKEVEPWDVVSVEWFSRKVINIRCVSPVSGGRRTFSVGKRSIGKTVFLTREEAERALAGGADHA